MSEIETVRDGASAFKVLMYSDDSRTRAEVIAAVGTSLGADHPKIEWIESATPEAALMKVREEKFDLLVLDAETPKLGGIGLGKMVRDEIDPLMPYVILIARPQDEWLARVAKPEAIVEYPIKPRELHSVVSQILIG